MNTSRDVKFIYRYIVYPFLLKGSGEIRWSVACQILLVTINHDIKKVKQEKINVVLPICFNIDIISHTFREHVSSHRII